MLGKKIWKGLCKLRKRPQSSLRTLSEEIENITINRKTTTRKNSSADKIKWALYKREEYIQLVEDFEGLINGLSNGCLFENGPLTVGDLCTDES